MAGVTLIAVGLGLAAVCHALEASIDVPREAEGYLWVDVRLDDLFSPRIEESLARGMPATFQFHAELWRRRGGWFDRLESGFDAAVKIRYDVWSKLYRIEQRGRAAITASTLDSVRAIVSRPLGLPVARTTALRPGPTYYVVVTVTLRPLTVEDIEEGEGWLSGEVATKRKAGLGVVTALPRAVFDAMRNFSGFGDIRARATSEDFAIEESEAAR